MTTLTVTDRTTSLAGADALVVLTYNDGDSTRVAPIDALEREQLGAIEQGLAALGAAGKADEVVKLTGIAELPALVLATGSGLHTPPGAADAEAVRRAAGSAVRSLTGKSAAVIAFPATEVALVAATAEGVLFGAYSYGDYKSSPTTPLAKATVLSPIGRQAAVRAAVKRATVVADEQAWARDLVNQPALDLYPASFADQVKKHFAGTGVRVQVADEKALAKQNCGGLLGVGRGSARPPRLVTLTYKPAKAKSHIALVGKGVTFDSGGLCIKPGTGMITMKCDMAGAAAVAATTAAIAALDLPVAVTTYLCLAENMTGADAQRPGDVVTMPNGKTVEIINTDAEGRLVMADGLSFASTLKPDTVIDVATLTGAAFMALGDRTTAVLSNDDDLRAEILDAAEVAGEGMWPIPMLEHLRPAMDSTVADIKHTGERKGGMITAALFLREFVGTDGTDIPWAHLDIAGPAFVEGSAFGYTPVGGTGTPVRTLVAFAESRA